MKEFKELLVETNKPIFDKLGSLEHKIDTATENINNSLITSAVLETKIQNLDKTNSEKHEDLQKEFNFKHGDLKEDVDKNWQVTRKLDSKVTKWSGVAVGLSIASGFVIKLFF